MSCDPILRPGDDLRAALASAPEGGCLCLAPGTWAAPIRVERSVTLRAADPDGAPVVLDAGGRGSVVESDAEDATILLEGLVLTGGSAAEAGGALRLGGHSFVTLRGCTLAGNRGGSYGGGAVFAADGLVRLERCRVVDNETEFGGAAVLLDGIGRAELCDTLVAHNRAGSGATLWIREGTRLTLDRATVADNRADMAIRVDSTTTRAPELYVGDSLLAHAGRLLAADEQPPVPDIRVIDSLLDGDVTSLGGRGSGNRCAPARFSGAGALEPYRPLVDSPAVGLTGAPAEGAVDLVGRPRTGTVGALEV